MSHVDAHQHYWNPARGDYGWMPKDNRVLSRSYAPDDLAPALRAVGVASTVLVQAAPTLAETEYLLGIADSTDSVAGVVGWVDFEDCSQRGEMERLAAHPMMKGLRPMIQDIEDVDWMLRDDVAWAYTALTDCGLTFDALGFPRHLDNFLTLFQRFPDMRVVIDHCMKPQIAEHSDASFDHWAQGMRRIAEETGAFCKLSGLVTEAAPEWSIDDLRPYASHVLEVFGPDRVMWGSDWPVSRLRCEYDAWLSAAETLTSRLSEGERARVFGGTAIEFYDLDVTAA